jgi:hypothetical protein
VSLIHRHRRRTERWLAGVAVLLAAAIPASHAPAATARPTPAPQVKPQITGLVDKGSSVGYTLRTAFPTADPNEVAPDASAFSAIVVNETWGRLEPTRGQLDFTPLQRSLAAVQSYNRVHPTDPLAVKLRIFGGFTAPGWAKTLDGPPISLTPAGQRPGTLGRWWESDYRSAWSFFQHALAARYDSDDLVQSVAVTSCATLTGEPFVISPSPAFISALEADGWSSAAEQRCLAGAFSDYSGWTHTPIEFSFNPFNSVTPGTTRLTHDFSVTEQIMKQCADLSQSTGRSCILANHALDATSASTDRSAPVYAEIDTLFTADHGTRDGSRVPVDFQTNSPDTFGGCEAIALAVRHHAQSLELWPPAKGFAGFSAFSPGTLRGWDRDLEHGRAPSC